MRSSNNTLYMKRPASWPWDQGRDSTPLGNGRTGVLVQGGTGREKIIFNRNDLWHHGGHTELPQMEGSLQEMRRLLDAGDYLHANDLMFERLRDSGYDSAVGAPFPLGCLQIGFDTNKQFSHYRRMLHMDKAECEITYTQAGGGVRRRCFVSRRSDTFYYEYEADEACDITVSFGVYEDRTSEYTPTPSYLRFCSEMGCTTQTRNGNGHTGHACNTQNSAITLVCTGNGIDFLAKTDWTEYGAKLRVYGAQVTADGELLRLHGRHFRIAAACCSGLGSTSRLQAPDDFDYAQKLSEHLPAHRRLYSSADIRLCRGKKQCNETLLDTAYEDQAPPELIEKMWRFGRYLFVCGTTAKKGGTPFPLYGLWHSRYDTMWPTNTANENVQIIYMHAAAGGLSELVRTLIDYYHSHMEDYRETARKLFGCKGIFVSSYTSPVNHSINPIVPVILHFTGVAGWLCQHFYQYYRMTDDKKMLKEKILPFMLEAAEFYLDYLTFDETGKILCYPDVSPENTPANLCTQQAADLGRMHPNPVTKNPTISIAIIRELFTNLSTLLQETGTHEEYLPALKKVLDALPPYRINADGAVSEWLPEELEDNYDHRHVSHLYPLFPGDEVSREKQPALYAAFERAVDLRKLGAQTGWSLSHTAAIYAVLGRGDRVLDCLDVMLKGCTMNNLVTLHNDYRNMGIAFDMEQFPVQMDANMGAVNAVQRMLLDERGDVLRLLPATSHRLACGSFTGLCFTLGRIAAEWDLNAGRFRARLQFRRSGTVTVQLPERFAAEKITLSQGAWQTAQNGSIRVHAEKGAVLVLECRK